MAFFIQSLYVKSSEVMEVVFFFKKKNTILNLTYHVNSIIYYVIHTLKQDKLFLANKN